MPTWRSSKNAGPRKTATFSTARETAVLPCSATSAGRPGGEKSFTLDESIGLSNRQSDYLVPADLSHRVRAGQGGRPMAWKPGDRVTLRVNPFELCLVSIEPLAALQEPIVLGCDYECCAGGAITLLGLPGAVPNSRGGRGGAAGRTEEVAFGGAQERGPLVQPLGLASRMPDAERSAKLAELLAGSTSSRPRVSRPLGGRPTFTAWWSTIGSTRTSTPKSRPPGKSKWASCARFKRPVLRRRSSHSARDRDFVRRPGSEGPFNVGVGVTQADLGEFLRRAGRAWRCEKGARS